MKDDKEKELARRLHSILPQMAGTARESVQYKINILDAPPTFYYTIPSVLSRQFFDSQVQIERRLLDGYRRIRDSCSRELPDGSTGLLGSIGLFGSLTPSTSTSSDTPSLNSLIDLSAKKLFFYDKLRTADFTGPYTHCDRTFGRLSLDFRSLTLDPCNAVESIALYVNREHHTTFSAHSLPHSLSLDLDESSVIEIMLLGSARHTLFGILLFPINFFVDRPGQLLPLAFDRFNFLQVHSDFRVTRVLRRDKLKNHFAMIEGHRTEKVTSHHFVYCTLCSLPCNPPCTVFTCLSCHIKVHSTCIDFLIFQCRQRGEYYDGSDGMNNDKNNVNNTSYDCYSISHQFETRISKGMQYCCHCGERITLGDACIRCIACRKNFHYTCRRNVLDTCGLSFEMLQKITELEALRDNQMEIGRKVAIGDFDILGSVARGALGRVVEARHKGEDRVVAIKTIPKAVIRDYRTWNGVKQEVCVLRRVSDEVVGECPFIAKIRFSFEDNYYIYIGMEYYRGGDLFGTVMKEELGEEQIRLYAAEIVVALEYLHGNGIVHQDMKLENILLTEEGHVRLCDFGSAITGVGYGDVLEVYCGTLQVAPPEAVRGEGFTMAVDFWALGILIYELFHKMPPFAGSHTPELIEAICNHGLDISAEMSEEARDFLERMLEKEQAGRLGFGAHGVRDIKAHPWFGQIDWEKVLREEVRPVYVPGVRKSDKREVSTRLTPVVAVPDIREHIKSIRKDKGNNTES